MDLPRGTRLWMRTRTDHRCDGYMHCNYLRRDAQKQPKWTNYRSKRLGANTATSFTKLISRKGCSKNKAGTHRIWADCSRKSWKTCLRIRNNTRLNKIGNSLPTIGTPALSFKTVPIPSALKSYQYRQHIFYSKKQRHFAFNWFPPSSEMLQSSLIFASCKISNQSK